jgi:hypothetical protein
LCTIRLDPLESEAAGLSEQVVAHRDWLGQQKQADATRLAEGFDRCHVAIECDNFGGHG